MTKARWLATYCALALASTPKLAAADAAQLQAHVETRTRAFLQSDQFAMLGGIARGTLDRARRAIAFGPEIGAGFARATVLGEWETPLSVGLCFIWFKVPVVPSTELIRDVIQARLQARVAEMIQVSLAGGATVPAADELERLARDIYESVKAEVIGEMSVRPKRFEKPRLAMRLEGIWWPNAADWEIRAGAGYGIKWITIGPTLAGHFGDMSGLLLGGEVALPIATAKQARSHPMILFARADFGMTNELTDHDNFLLGVRFMLDAI